MMDSRERVFTAVEHKEVDRPPVFATFTPEVDEALRSHCNITGDVDTGYALGNDMVKVTVGMENSFYMTDDPIYTCPFGVVWKNVKNSSGAYTEIVDGALRDDEDGLKLKNYKIPDPHNPELYTQVKAAVDRYGKDKIIVGSCQCSVFETAWYLTGLEDFLAMMLTDEDYTDELLDKVMQFPLHAGLHMIEAGVDVIWLGDDVATQLDMMISVPDWRRYLKERYAYMFSEFKKANKNILLAYHCCGNCERIIDELAEIGLDMLQPIQPQAMDPYMVKERHGKNVTLFGGLDIQDLFPNGTKQQVVQTVYDYKRYLGAGGGYIVSPAHHLQSDTSVEKICAFYEEAKKPVEKYDYKYVR